MNKSILLEIFLIVLSTCLLITPVHASAPKPTKANSDYLIGAFVMPSWRIDEAQNSWLSIDHISERKPLLGYYDDHSPAAWDWQTKWALEHGVNFFIFDWYRCTGLGADIYYNRWTCETSYNQPIDDDHVALGSTLHEGFLKSQYKDQMKFAIMPTIDLSWASVEDLRNNVMPYWINKYFKQPNYLKIDGKPVLFLFDTKIINTGKYGGSQAISVIRTKMTEAGFPGIIILGDANDFSFQAELPTESLLAHLGFDYLFQYNIFPYKVDNAVVMKQTEDQSIRGQYQAYQYLLRNSPLPFVTTASPMWDSYYMDYDANNPTLPVQHISATGYKTVLNNLKAIASQIPANQLGHKMILVDAWNEFTEGHYIAPTQQYGFSYLQAIREILTYLDNTPDENLPTQNEIDSFSSLYNNYSRTHLRDYSLLKSRNVTLSANNHFYDVNNPGFRLENATALTIGAWFKPSAISTNTFLMNKTQSFNLLAQPDGSGHCAIGTKNNVWYSSGTVAQWPSGLIAPNTWHHIACVYNGSNVTVYIDGRPAGNTAPNSLSGNVKNAIYNIYLGMNYPSAPAQYSGNIANMVLENRAFTASEIEILSRNKPAIQGDINHNNLVNIYDYNALISDFGKTGDYGFTNSDIDINGQVNIYDYNVLLGDFSAVQ